MILIHNLSWIPELDPTLVSIEKNHKNAYGKKNLSEMRWLSSYAQHDTTRHKL